MMMLRRVGNSTTEGGWSAGGADIVDEKLVGMLGGEVPWADVEKMLYELPLDGVLSFQCKFL